MSRRLNELPAPQNVKPRPPEPATKMAGSSTTIPAVDKTPTLLHPANVYPDRESYLIDERKMLDLYQPNTKTCPRCGKYVRMGFIGHISKCLRTSIFKTA